MKFGDYLRGQREEKDWTQPVAAKEIGIEQSYLSKLETGKAYPSDEIFDKLQAAYGFDTKALGNALFDGEIAKLRGVGALRDFAVQRERLESGMIRRWILAGLALLTIGAGITAYELHKPHQTSYAHLYLSKGKIMPGEDDFVLAHLPSRAELEAVKAQINRAFTPRQLKAIKENGNEIPNLLVAPEEAKQLEARGEVLDFTPRTGQIKCYDQVQRQGCNMTPEIGLRLMNAPLLERLDEQILYRQYFDGTSFSLDYDGGAYRRVYTHVRTDKAVSIGPNNLLLSIGIAMMVAGLYAGVMARRWR